jgi:hypothetical protein
MRPSRAENRRGRKGALDLRTPLMVKSWVAPEMASSTVPAKGSGAP